MDLVTTLAVSVLCAGIQAASSCPTSAPFREAIIFIDASGSPEAHVPAQTSVKDKQLEFSTIARWQHFITEASRRFGIREVWIRAVIAAESAGEATRDGRPITSRAGAMGLMQVMPDTYAEMRARHALGPDPYDPRDNILAGTAYLRAMYDRYGYPGFFAAYNAGPTRFEAYLLRGVPLPVETQQYLLSIGPDVSEAVVAQRPDAAVALLTKAPRSPASLSSSSLFFPVGIPFATARRASLGASGEPLMRLESSPRSAASVTLFVPLKSSRGVPAGAAKDR